MLENETDALVKANEINTDTSTTFTAIGFAERASDALGMKVWKLSTSSQPTSRITGAMFHISADSTLFSIPVIKLNEEEFASKVREKHEAAQKQV